MLPVVHLAATALLLSPHAAAFVSPSQLQQRQSHVQNGAFATATAAAAAAAAPATTTARRTPPRTTRSASGGLLATKLAAADLGGGGGGTVRGDGGGNGADGAKGKPPRSVLERPWDVEVDFHGERRVITVQPGDSILEAVRVHSPSAFSAEETKEAFMIFVDHALFAAGLGFFLRLSGISYSVL